MPPANSCQRPALVVSDDATFVGRIFDLWSKDDQGPLFRVLRSDTCVACRPADYEFVVMGGLRPEVRASVLQVFRSSNTPLIVIGEEGEVLRETEAEFLNLVRLDLLPSWDELLFALAAEVGCRSRAQMQASQVEHEASTLQREAALGRYIIEMRHNLNNALTSVLGNTELLLLDESRLEPGERKQIETIRGMTLRMHETLQRFSALERERQSASLPDEDRNAFARITQARLTKKLPEECRRLQMHAAGAD